MNVLRRAVVVFSLCTLSLAAQDSDRFVSAAARLSLRKPAGWTFVTTRTKANLTQEEVQSAFAQKKVVPLVGMTRDGAPFSDFQVTLMPRTPALAKASPKQVLELLILPSIQKAHPGLTLEGAVREREISGQAAAEYVARDTIRTGDMAMPVRIQAILVASGSYFYLIDITAAANDEQTSRGFEQIVSSITIGQ